MFAKTAITSLAALAAVGFAATAHASPADARSSDPAATSVTVSVADLNLSSPAGAATVLHRIRSAARTICGGEPDIRSERFALYQSCVKATVDRTVASLGSPMVTALNDGQAGAMTLASRR